MKSLAKKSEYSNLIKNMSVIICILLLLVGAIIYWWYSQRYVSTNDAYVGANVVQIAPQVSGRVTQLNIKNNQYIAKDAILFTIEQTPFTVANNKAQAELTMALAKQQNAQRTSERILELVNKKLMPAQNADNVTADLQSANAAVQQAQAGVAAAQLNLQYTTISAPTSGWVSNVSLRVGDTVTMDRPVFALISDNEFWVDANFKETDLEYIKPGQKADIDVDMYSNQTFHGVVESISGASGSAFSLLPPENATGNWVKVTQRVPVRVKVIDLKTDEPLRIGTSANVTIHIKEE